MIPILLGIFFYSMTCIASEPSLDVKVNRNTIRLDQSIELSFKVTYKEGEPTITEPKFQAENFSIAGRTLRRHRASIYENGQFIVKKVQHYSYTMYPKEPGLSFIRDLHVEVDGVSLRSSDISVSVKNFGNARRLNQPPINRQNRILPKSKSQITEGQLFAPEGNPQFFLAVETSKTKAYVGEEILVNYWAYRDISVTDLLVTKWPSLPGFWKEELDLKVHHNWEITTYNGQVYRRTLLAQYAVFPVKPGKNKLDSISVNAQLLTSNNRNNPWSAFSRIRTIPSKKTSKIVEIDVLKLPPNNTGVPYSGIVGKLNLKLMAKNLEVSVDQPMELKILATGGGVLKSLENPLKSFPKEFEFFDDTKNATYRIGGNSRNEFKVRLIPRQNGSFQFGPLKQAYFDPKEKVYKIASSNSLAISVTGTPSANPETKKESSLLGGLSDKKEIEKTYQATPLQEELPKRNSWLFISLSIWVLAGILGVLLWIITRKKKYLGSEAYQQKLIDQKISASKSSLLSKLNDSNPKDTLASLKEFLGARFNQDPALVTKSLLEKEGMSELASCLDRLNQFCFGPQENPLDKDFQKKLKQIILDT